MASGLGVPYNERIKFLKKFFKVAYSTNKPNTHTSLLNQAAIPNAKEQLFKKKADQPVYYSKKHHSLNWSFNKTLKEDLVSTD